MKLIHPVAVLFIFSLLSGTPFSNALYAGDVFKMMLLERKQRNVEQMNDGIEIAKDTNYTKILIPFEKKHGAAWQALLDYTLKSEDPQIAMHVLRMELLSEVIFASQEEDSAESIADKKAATQEVQVWTNKLAAMETEAKKVSPTLRLGSRNGSAVLNQLLERRIKYHTYYRDLFMREASYYQNRMRMTLLEGQYGQARIGFMKLAMAADDELKRLALRMEYLEEISFSYQEIDGGEDKLAQRELELKAEEWVIKLEQLEQMTK